MANKTSKKSGFTLTPIKLSEPIKTTDGFTNLVETAEEKAKTIEPPAKGKSEKLETKRTEVKGEAARIQDVAKETGHPKKTESKETGESNADKFAESGKSAESEKQTGGLSLSTSELLRILDAGSLDEIYELTDVLRASSLKLYATLIRLADSRGRARVKNHELMSKAGIKGIATLYKQERWLMDLKLLEKKAKPGPHDGSSYVVHKLETLPLPDEIFEKFDAYLAGFEQIV